MNKQTLEQLTTSLSQFFSSYLTGFIKQQVQLVASCYQVPCIMTTPDEMNILDSHQALVNKFNQIFSQLDALQVDSYQIRHASVQRLEKSQVLVLISWQLFAQTQPVTEFSVYYTVEQPSDRRNSAFVIRNVISHHLENTIELVHDFTDLLKEQLHNDN
jgi:hypothetical protein